jgi:hypothetical protein
MTKAQQSDPLEKASKPINYVDFLQKESGLKLASIKTWLIARQFKIDQIGVLLVT